MPRVRAGIRWFEKSTNYFGSQVRQCRSVLRVFVSTIEHNEKERVILLLCPSACPSGLGLQDWERVGL